LKKKKFVKLADENHNLKDQVEGLTSQHQRLSERIKTLEVLVADLLSK
jgi:archaellum component FlaC